MHSPSQSVSCTCTYSQAEVVTMTHTSRNESQPPQWKSQCVPTQQGEKRNHTRNMLQDKSSNAQRGNYS